VSEHERPKDVFTLLGGFYLALHRAVSGEHGSPAVTALARVTVLLLGLGCAGPILWAALRDMPAALALFLGAALVLRVVRWFLRRSQ